MTIKPVSLFLFHNYQFIYYADLITLCTLFIALYEYPIIYVCIRRTLIISSVCHFTRIISPDMYSSSHIPRLLSGRFWSNLKVSSTDSF
jgi:hypothetical protein